MGYLGNAPARNTPAYKQVYEFVATAGQTTFAVPYTPGFVEVYRNGVKLGAPNFTANSGTSVVLTSGANAGDFIQIVSEFINPVLNAIPNTAGAVATSNIADGAITTAKIANGAVVQADLATGVAGTGPAFAAFASGNQSIPNSVQTVLVYATEEFDTANRFNNTGSTVNGIPAYAFLPNVAGYYQVNWNVIMDQAASTTEFLARLLKNGVNYYWSSNQTTANNHYNAINGSVLMYLNGTTDYIQAAIFQNNGGSVTTRTEAGSYGFSACLVRAA